MALLKKITSTSQRHPLMVTALVLMCGAMAFGGSLYFQQKKAKTNASATAKKETKENKETQSDATDKLAAGSNTPSALTELALGGSPSAQRQRKAEPQTPARRSRKPTKAQDKKDAQLAENILETAPTGAGVPENAPAAPSPIVVAEAPAPVPEAAPAPQTPVVVPAPVASLIPGPEAPGAPPIPLPDGVAGGGIPTPTPVVPVPEPSTWLMLAAGLGLIASRARRG